MVELDDKMKFLEIIEQLLARKSDIVNVQNTIITLMDDFNNNWENEGPQALRCVLNFVGVRISNFSLFLATIYITKHVMYYSSLQVTTLLVCLTINLRKRMDILDEELSKKWENEVFKPTIENENTESLETSTETPPQFRVADRNFSVDYHQIVTKDGEHVETVTKCVGPIWGQFEAAAKVRRYMENSGMKNWEWHGSWNSEGGTSYAHFQRKINH